MFKLQTITILVCAASALTSSVTETDGSLMETRVDPIERFHDPGGLHYGSEPITKLEKNLTNAAPTMGVGDPIHRAETTNSSTITLKTAPKATVVAEGIELTFEDSAPADSKSKLPKIRNASVVARKGAIQSSKILPRKGVGLELLMPMESSTEGIDEAVHPAVSTVAAPRKKVEQVTEKIGEKNHTKIAAIEEKLGAEHIRVPVSANETRTTIKINSTTAPTIDNVGSTIETKIADVAVTSSTPSPKRFKPKPTVTIGEMNDDKPIPASPTKTPPLGMPRKIDYIVPVIITIMALPLLGGAAFFLYRRGRDCWDKRHYRRMDFLIDGMYNDYSWK